RESDDGIEKPRRTGSPAFAGDDSNRQHPYDLDAVLHLAPLAGRGRRRREATSPGEGDYPRVRACREPPSPARKMLATSPRKRGEVKNGRRASHGLLRGAGHRARIRATRWLAMPGSPIVMAV